MKITGKKFTLIIILCVVISALWKIALLVWGRFPFNSDEAIVGLMARHILEGERPVFFYGQVYMGSLDAYLVAVGFAVFGAHVWVIRMVQVILYSLVVLTTMMIVKNVTRNVHALILSGLLLAFPTVNMTLYTTVSLGGYCEALLIGNILVLVTQSIQKTGDTVHFEMKNLFLRMFMWGMLCGVGVWVNGLTLVYILPTGLMNGWFLFKNKTRLRKIDLFASLWVIVTGFAMGAIPYWIYGFRNGWGNLIGELFGSAVAVEAGSFFSIAWQHLANLIVLGIPVIFSLRPPWAVKWLVLPLIPFIILIWGWILWKFFISIKNKKISTETGFLLVGISATLCLAFTFSSFGIDPSGRYFLPISVILAIVAGITAVHFAPSMRAIGFLLLIAFQISGTLQSAVVEPEMLTTQFYAPTIIDHRYDQELIDFLKTNDLSFGYTNYWAAYPLAFLSHEELIYIPRLPYHLDLRYTERDDRILIYREMVENAEEISYITTNNPSLDDYLLDSFNEKDFIWSEKTIGDYRIFYHFSKVVRPEEIGLGVTK